MTTHRGEIERIEAQLRAAGWAEHTSIKKEIRCWMNLAAEVNAYTFTIDDYTNDLCSRDYLAEAMSLASPGLRPVLAEDVSAADDRFRERTSEDLEAAIGHFYRIDLKDGWWWRRRPRPGPLAQYLSDAT